MCRLFHHSMHQIAASSECDNQRIIIAGSVMMQSVRVGVGRFAEGVR